MVLTNQPLWLSGLLLVGFTTLVAMLGPIVVRRRVDLQRLSTNNEVAGFKFATVGVLYAVLLAFVVIVVWEKFSDAEADVTKEAGAAAAIYRLAAGVGAEPGASIDEGITHYLQTAVVNDWPAMEQGKASPLVTKALNDLYARLLLYNPPDRHGAVILAELLHQLDVVAEARRARLIMAAGIVPGLIWTVLFGGAVLTVSFTFFFGTVNLRAQTMMTGALSMLIFSGLLIIVAIDHPFMGAVKVGSEPLVTVLEDFGK